MSQPPAGSLRLFRLAGIDVYAHWTWLVIAAFQLWVRSGVGGRFAYDWPGWYVLELFVLFAIVLLHEFGHALACVSVGGTAPRVVLWLLGGAANVTPPPRPGPWLWSMAGGPLVNLLLVPVLFLLSDASTSWSQDSATFFFLLNWMNVGLLVLNLLPVLPFDGGLIVHSLLWFVIGRVPSLLAVSVFGLVVGGAAVVFGVERQNKLLMLLAAYIALRCLAGFQQGMALLRILRGPRHNDVGCPSCGEAPFAGNYWVCEQCHTHFDAFEHRAMCPNCGEPFPTTMCPLCQQRHPIDEWLAGQASQPDSLGPGDSPLVNEPRPSG
jgi:Zn-dependent protease